SSSPARLDEARDQTLRPEVAERDAAHLELAIVGARAPRHLAAIADARARGVARQLGELQRRREPLFHRQRLVAGDLLEPQAPPGNLLRQLAPPLVLLNRTLLRHSYLLG